MIYSTSAVYAGLRYENSYYFLQRHLIHIISGWVITLTPDPLPQMERLAPFDDANHVSNAGNGVDPRIGHEVKRGRDGYE